MSQIRSKRDQYRKSLRSQQVQAYFRQIRESTINSRMRDDQIRQLNEKVQRLIKGNQLLQLYDYLYCRKAKKENNQVPIAHLQQKTIDLLLEYISKNFVSNQAQLLLNNVIDLHYKTIFLNFEKEERSNALIKSLYTQTRICVQKYIDYLNSKQSGPNPMSSINYVLNNIKSLIFNKEEANEEGNIFKQMVREEYIIGHLFNWFEYLIDNPIYLIILTVLEYDSLISGSNQVKNYLNKSPKLMRQLLYQSDPDKLTFKSCSLPSVTLANSFVKQIQNKKIIEQLIPDFLQSSKIIYKYTQSNTKSQFYRFPLFSQTLSNTAEMFKKVSNLVLEKCLCEYMKQTSFWTFITIFLRCEGFEMRRIIMRMIYSALQNLLICKAPLEQYMTEVLIGLIGQGLEYNLIDMAILSLNNFSLIFTYCSQHIEESRRILDWIKEYDIDTSLQNLEYHNNKELADMTAMVMEKKKRFNDEYQGNMECE